MGRFMKAVFTSTDPQEIKRMAKSSDMASALFEIINNAHRHKETLDDYRKEILEIVEQFDINIDELT